tara:strand:- start:292 stop:504 length:213 start_codon:yes stop_codon:yes gene_type:complete
MNISIETMSVVFAVLVYFLIILLMRSIVCWYFKINKRVELQKNILIELVKINATPEGTDHLFITKYGDKL